ncbi:coiled-coil domain-containing protein 114 [Ictalurus furcatus]|uniref:coiled-coil domain-containing protein 114 n=1 Tax=Ictalurus furcatus TaxID=66913 RepID=UPI00235033C4|nr:coiled-coil domain-containing protein 114 [Ictalurus furcatus]XP_053508921.1 coiled-coil domain-containing protein 114 [Ictalurus furcatus]XP_053508922.1 coiled-coil domain-containing protein 114 [Ictalurus furcatus]
MPRGRSAISVHSDSSDMDIDTLGETEMGKLQRQFRIMEADRQAYSIQSQELIRKQRLEMEKLREEHEELQKNLRASASQLRRQTDSHDAQQLRALLNRLDELNEQLERERLSQAELDREIQNIQKKLEELRKGDVSTFHSQKSQARHIQKATRTLENKLDRALVRFNEQLAKNSQLREELETLRVERVRFQQLHHKLDKELREIRQEIGDVIGMSTAAYDSRVEAQTKMTMMKEKAVKDLAQYTVEMKELERLIAHEQRLKDFMTTKCKERTGLDDALSHRHEMKEQRRTDSEVAAETLEEVFQRIQKVTGEDDLEMLVTKFIQAEDRNFALFNYVNEQNTQAEALKDQIRQIKEEMERFQVEDLQQEQEHHTTLKQMEEQQRDTETQALEYEARVKEITQILDQIKTGVSAVFNKIDCDHAAVDDLPGSLAGIRDSDIMTYLRLVEQKTNMLLTVQAFINSKDPEKDYDPKLAAQELLGKIAEMQKQAPVVQPPVPGDDYDIEDLLLPHEEDQPLPQEELRQRIMNRILQKEEALHAGKSKEARSAKLSAQRS